MAHWLRARDPSSTGFFRDCDLELVPFVSNDELARTPQSDKLRKIEQAWQQRLAHVIGAVPAVVSEVPQQLVMAAPQAA